MSHDCQMCQKRLDVSGTHFIWVSLIMKQNVSSCPRDIGCFCAERVVFKPDSITELIEKFWCLIHIHSPKTIVNSSSHGCPAMGHLTISCLVLQGVSIIFLLKLHIKRKSLITKRLQSYSSALLAILYVPSAPISREFQHYGRPGHLFCDFNIGKIR